jgi:O-antigen ligase
MSWILFEYLRTHAEFCAALTYFVAGALLMACMTIRSFSLVNVAALAVTDLRVSAFGANPNELGLTLAITLPAALHVFRSAPRVMARLIGGAYLILGPVAVLLSASRSAVIVLVLVSLGMVWMLRDTRRFVKVSILAGVMAVAAVVLSIIPAYTWDRLATIGAKLQRMDLNNRTDNWQAGIEYLLNSPFLGVGAGAFQGAATHLRTVAWSSHSSWVGVLVETGFIGAVLWFSGIGLALVGLRRAVPQIRTLLLVTALPMMTGMLVTGWDHRKVPWFVFSLLILAPLLRPRVLKDEERS